MNITIAGAGYVGLSLATLLSVQHNVKVLDVVQEKVDKINNRIAPIKEDYIEKYFREKKLNLIATTDKEFAYKDSHLVIVATPTNYDENTHYFDTSSIDDVILNVLKYNKDVDVFIKSTVPVGFTENIRLKYNKLNIYFSPEFLREGRSLYDNLYPSRIVVGDKGRAGKLFSKLLFDASIDRDAEILLMNSSEAEAVKLFSNSYLAMRVAYFNELDMYSETMGLNTKDIILGMCADPRIGEGYNNPSFGYGGYCFPKDTKQLVANYKELNIENSLISSIVDSNKVRKEFIVKQIMLKNPKTVCIYKLAMKSNSDNFRSSAVFDIINNLKANGVEVLIFEPTVNEENFVGCRVVDFNSAINCDLIVTNRLEKELVPYINKVYTRDVFNNN